MKMNVDVFNYSVIVVKRGDSDYVKFGVLYV